jgi:hypothetical protein
MNDSARFSFESYIEAYAEEGDIPAIWTPEHVTYRLVEVFDVLRRTPMRYLPKVYGNAWPTMVREYSDMVDTEKLAEALVTGQTVTARGMVQDAEAEARRIAEQEAAEEVERKSKIPLPDEVSRAEEAMCWSMTYLQRRPMQADGLQAWAFCTAGNIPIDVFLRARTAIADAMVHRRKWDSLRNSARMIADRANSMMELDPKSVPSIRARAHAAFKEVAALKLTVQRKDVWPDRVFTQRWLHICRKEGAEEIAFRLRRDGVGVR